MLAVSISLESLFKELHFGTKIKFTECSNVANRSDSIFFCKTTRNSYISP